jgi:predicted DNA-binding transcriptional regulator AlpA
MHKVNQNHRRALRQRELLQLIGVSRSQLYRMVANDQIPQPARISVGCKVWDSREIDAWLDERFAERVRYVGSQTNPKLANQSVFTPRSLHKSTTHSELDTTKVYSVNRLKAAGEENK